MILDKFQLKGKVAIITGARPWMGPGYGPALAEAGADVALVDIVESSETAAMAEKVGSRALVLTADLSKSGSPARVVADTVSHFGRLDILFNVAGTQVRKPIPEVTEQGL